MKTRSSRSGKGFGKGRQPQRPRHQTQFQSVQEWDDDFLALFPHRYDYLWAEHPHPDERPDWQTESRHPLTDRLIKQGTYSGSCLSQPQFASLRGNQCNIKIVAYASRLICRFTSTNYGSV